MVFNDSSFETVPTQRDEITRAKEYKYSEVCINEEKRYVNIHEKELKINVVLVRFSSLMGLFSFSVQLCWKPV